MDNQGALTFSYAKACGILGKSFVNSRANLLFEQNSLSDLWTLIFKTPVPLMPERLLAEEIEKQALNQLIKQFSFFISQFDKPDSILIEQFKIFEIENLKEIGDSLCSGETVCPPLVDLGKYSSLHTEFWPNLAKITKGTEFEWYNTVPRVHEQQQRDFALDLYLVKSYWKEINKFRGEEKEAHLKLFLDEYVIKNVIWALRLLVYYEMDSEEIVKNLFYVENLNELDPVAGPAIRALRKNPTVYSDWTNWEFADLLNPNDAGEWKIDPVWIENKALQKRQKLADFVFRQYPMSSAALVAWFKLKRYELVCIKIAVESARLNINSQETLNSMGISVVE